MPSCSSGLPGTTTPTSPWRTWARWPPGSRPASPACSPRGARHPGARGDPGRSWADLGYLGMVPFALAGIGMRPILRPRDVNRLLLLLDAGVALSGLSALG